MARMRAFLRRHRGPTYLTLVLVIAVAALMVVFVPLHPGSTSRRRASEPVPGPVPVPQAVDPQFVPKQLSFDPQISGDFGSAIAANGAFIVIGAALQTVGGDYQVGSAFIVNRTTGLATEVSSPTPPSAGQFGSAVAISGDRVAVGSPYESANGLAGAGHVYLYSTSGILLATYTSPNASAGGGFGGSVALEGPTLVVGANGETVGTLSSAGAAYLIDTSSNSYRRIISPFPDAGGAFGSSVAISGGRVAVGAQYETSGGTAESGNAYVYELATGNLIETIANPVPESTSNFARDLALSGTTLVVGASNAYAGLGQVYVYNVNGGLGYGLSSPVSPSVDFGASVATDGTAVVVGAPNEANGAGYAFLFSVASPAAVGANLTTEVPGAELGTSVAIVGSSVLVGAPGLSSEGVVYSGGAYEFDQVPLAVTSDNLATDGNLGTSVAIDQGVMIAGAPYEAGYGSGITSAGNAYIVSVDPGHRLALGSVLSSPNAENGGTFGTAVAISDGVAVVGAPGETVGGHSVAGRAYVFDATTGSLLETLSSPVPQDLGFFGYSVAICGNEVLVGAPLEDSAEGNAYLFNATNGNLQAVFFSPLTGTGAYFGLSVSVNGTTALIGAPNETVSGVAGAGHAYLFNVTSGQYTYSLQSPQPQVNGTFGWAVSVAGDVAVVGAPSETASGDTTAGKVYGISVATGALAHSYVSVNPTIAGKFGNAVDTNGATVVIGAPGETAVGVAGAGNLYIFDPFTGGVVSRVNSLTPQSSGAFGSSVAEDGLRVVAGAPGEASLGVSAAGQAYILLYGPTPVTWTQSYYTALMSVYNSRADLQASFPNAPTNTASYQGLLAWAKGVVEQQWVDGAYSTLEPFAAEYEALG